MDHPYLLPLGGEQHYCHSVDYFLILGLDTYHRIQLKNIGYLTGKAQKKDELRQNYLHGTKIRNARQIQKFLARKKIWNC